MSVWREQPERFDFSSRSTLNAQRSTLNAQRSTCCQNRAFSVSSTRPSVSKSTTAVQGPSSQIGGVTEPRNTTGPARHGPADPDIAARIEAQMNAEELVCEEMMLEKFNAS